MSSGTSYGGGLLDNVLRDHDNVKKHAKHHGGNSADRGIFDSALSAIQGNASHLQSQGVNEKHAVKAHKKYYEGDSGEGGEATSSGMGAAAAMQALKMFNSGGSSSSSSSSGGSQEFMGMAMGQAAKLFDSQSASGNVSSDASKQSVVQEAGEMALKMYMQSEMGGTSGGSGLMSMASKFM